MATIVPLLGHEILVQIGNGADPEVFSHPVLINTSRSLAWSADVAAEALPDASDQSLPGKMTRRLKSWDFKIDGSGLLPSTDVDTFRDWLKSGEPKNVKAQTGDLTETNAMICTAFNISGSDRLELVEVQITLELAGDAIEV